MIVGKINERFSTIFATSYDFPLKDSFLLDSASSIHVPPGHYALCGSGTVAIHVDVVVTNQQGRKRILRLHKVAYCPQFPTNIVSLQLLEDRGIDWKQ